MKKSKKYSTKKGKKLVREGLTNYSGKILTTLYNMSYQDMSKVELPGDSLTKIQQQTSLGVIDIASILGVSKSTYYNMLEQDFLDTESVDALIDFAILWQKGLDAFDDDASLLNEWLDTRNTNLGGIIPVELLSTRVGRREIEKSFLRIEYSIYG